MLLICNVPDLIKSILFSLNFEHLPFFPVAWGSGQCNAVRASFMSRQHVIKCLPGYCCKAVLGRAGFSAQMPETTLQREVKTLLPMKWILITQECSAWAGCHPRQSILAEEPETPGFQIWTTFPGPAKLIVVFHVSQSSYHLWRGKYNLNYETNCRIVA